MDGILSGVVSTNQDMYIVDFTAHDLSGRELFRQKYRHVIDSTIHGIVLSAGDERGPDFYFPGLDGVTQPKCTHCRSPEYSDAARNDKREGTIILYVLITPQGKPDDIYVAQTSDPVLSQSAIKGVKSWRLSRQKTPTAHCAGTHRS